MHCNDNRKLNSQHDEIDNMKIICILIYSKMKIIWFLKSLCQKIHNFKI